MTQLQGEDLVHNCCGEGEKSKVGFKQTNTEPSGVYSGLDFNIIYGNTVFKDIMYNNVSCLRSV